MSTLEAALIIAAVLVVGLPVTYVQIRRAQRHDSERDRIIRASLLTPEAAREVDDLELLYSQPAYDKAWDAGRERLWDAVRDNQQKEAGDA
jgi:hypothetical protein